MWNCGRCATRRMVREHGDGRWRDVISPCVSGGTTFDTAGHLLVGVSCCGGFAGRMHCACITMRKPIPSNPTWRWEHNHFCAARSPAPRPTQADDGRPRRLTFPTFLPLDTRDTTPRTVLRWRFRCCCTPVFLTPVLVTSDRRHGRGSRYCSFASCSTLWDWFLPITLCEKLVLTCGAAFIHCTACYHRDARSSVILACSGVACISAVVRTFCPAFGAAAGGRRACMLRVFVITKRNADDERFFDNVRYGCGFSASSLTPGTNSQPSDRDGTDHR